MVTGPRIIVNDMGSLHMKSGRNENAQLGTEANTGTEVDTRTNITVQQLSLVAFDLFVLRAGPGED